MTARQQFESLHPGKSAYVDRAEALSDLTIPSLFRRTHAGSYDALTEPFQSEGAQGVMNLAAKFLLTILPPNGHFARLEVPRFQLAEALQKEGMEISEVNQIKTEVEESLNVVMQEFHAFLDTSSGLRPTAFELFQHLIVTGNGVFEIDSEVIKGRPELRFTLHTLHNYVVERDRSGVPNLLIIREWLSRANAPERALSLFMEKQEEVELYTVLERVDRDTWEVRQEINDNVVPGTQGRYTPETNPFIISRFIPVSQEAYGRSWAEHLHGDLRSLEGLSQALVEGAAAAARLIPFLDPNSGVSARRLNEARNGEIQTGRGDALTFANVQKQADFQFALAMEERIARRLARAFLRTTSVQRDGERVTAEEIRLMAQELESAFGGVYSTVAEEFQRPLASRVLYLMEKHKMIPALPRDLVRVGVVTGIGNLGRGRDLQDLGQGIGAIANLLGPQAVAGLIDTREAAARILNAVGVDTRGFLKSNQQMQAERQQAMMAQAAMESAPELVRQGGEMIREAQAPQ